MQLDAGAYRVWKGREEFSESSDFVSYTFKKLLSELQVEAQGAMFRGAQAQAPTTAAPASTQHTCTAGKGLSRLLCGGSTRQRRW